MASSVASNRPPSRAASGSVARPSTTTSTARHRGAQTRKVTAPAARLAPSPLIRSNEDPMTSPFALVLHTHLPMVVNHGRWPHGSDWLCEAAFECYLPLLETAHRLVADGISPKWTINLSPVLTEQLASPEFQKELSFYYENVRRACVESREFFSKLNEKQIVGLTYFWEEFYERMWELHRRIGGDIPGTFAELQRGGHLEIITCAATHGYLPLLSRDESIHLQLRTGVEAHKRHFGRAPRGGPGPAPGFTRAPRSTLQVWSRDHGYPGEFHYLESHKKHFPGGLRFWRISDSSGDLGRKQVYDPKIAAEKVGLQASHFVGIVKETIDANRDSIGALVCSPYDSELKRVLNQVSRELLLLQSSDWQFLITTGAARDYAERRVAEHYAEFKRLSEMVSRLRGGEPLSIEAADTLRRLEREDFVFPDLDTSWAQAPAP